MPSSLPSSFDPHGILSHFQFHSPIHQTRFFFFFFSSVGAPSSLLSPCSDLNPNPITKKHGRFKSPERQQKFQESSYMDPAQDLCLGALFDVAATNVCNVGLQEKLTMTVAVPYLWGVPPAAERLHLAVRTGGGIVDKVYWQ